MGINLTEPEFSDAWMPPADKALLYVGLGVAAGIVAVLVNSFFKEYLGYDVCSGRMQPGKLLLRKKGGATMPDSQKESGSGGTPFVLRKRRGDLCGKRKK